MRLRALRAASGLSGNRFAQQRGWPQPRVSKLESGRRRSGVTPGAEESPGVRRRWITGTVLLAALMTGCGSPPPASAPPAPELPLAA
ncbi:MAG: helix-turn-helix domain-containing protein, partial [Pseudonocardiaceae bacterium]